MNPRQPPPVIFDSARSRAHKRRANVMLYLGLTVPAPLFMFLLLGAGGLNFTPNASEAAWNASVVILPFPVLGSLVLGGKYLARRRRKGLEAPSPDALIASGAMVLFWVCALGWQSHKDAVYQSTLEARLQPWAESTLARPRAEVVDKGYDTVRKKMIPEFVGRRNWGRVRLDDAGDPFVEANERAVVVTYGIEQVSTGYIAGRRTLKVKEGTRGARKIRDGLYKFGRCE